MQLFPVRICPSFEAGAIRRRFRSQTDKDSRNGAGSLLLDGR